eukprot:g551.t1
MRGGLRVSVAEANEEASSASELESFSLEESKYPSSPSRKRASSASSASNDSSVMPPAVLRRSVSGSRKIAVSREEPVFSEMPRDEVSSPSSPTSTTRGIDAKLRHIFEFQGWKVGSRYRLERLAGKGSYGSVAIATDLAEKRKRENPEVAIKRIRKVFETKTSAQRVLRELRILRHMRDHRNIIEMRSVIAPDDFSEIYVVFEAMDFDMSRLLDDRKQWITPDHTRYFLHQLLVATSFLHSANIVHRDLKPANVLLKTDCTLKLCDFGLAREISTRAKGDRSPSPSGSQRLAAKASNASLSPPLRPKSHKYSTHVVTRWYRAPELILRNANYSAAVDVWSIGCILAELLNMEEGVRARCPHRRGEALFPGTSCALLSPSKGALFTDQKDQLTLICSVLGRPEDTVIDRMGRFSDPAVRRYLKSLPRRERRFDALFPASDADALDILRDMLRFDHAKRATADTALRHPYLAALRGDIPPRNVCLPLPSEERIEMARSVEGARKLLQKEIGLIRDERRA